MKTLFKILLTGLFYLLIFNSCEKEEEMLLSFNSVKIKSIINNSTGNLDTITFVYNDNELIYKGMRYGEMCFSNEYDDLNRITRMDSYSSNGLYLYLTFQYDSNSITRIRYQYYPYSDTWGGDNEKSVYIYNSQSNCERIDYYTKDENENWIKSIYYTLCFWNNDNLTELKHYEGNNLDYIETYQYDNKFNPEKLLNYAISPWTKSKNNPIRISTIYSDGRETNISFNYKYNEYGYPKEKESNYDICDLSETTEYEYEFR
jgi:hypothetical protein